MGTHGTDKKSPPVPAVVEQAYGLYPGLESFSEEYGAEDYGEWVEQSNGDPVPAPLAVYIQDTTRDGAPPVRGKDISSSRKPDAIEQELRLQGALFDTDRPVQQLICAGSIATEWTDDQLYQLISVVRNSFTVSQSDASIWCACLGAAIPPESRLRLLRVLGISNIRVSMGESAQAWDDDEAARTLADIESLAGLAHQLGIKQFSLDLYFSESGRAVPSALLENFMGRVMPDRIRLVGHDKSSVTAAGQEQRHYCAHVLSELGYQHVGLDWFVRPDDRWWQASLSGQLHWSMLGFTDMPSPDVVGIGPGAVSAIADFYGQNAFEWDVYQRLLNNGTIPVVRGLELENVDILRREILVMILTRSRIDIAAIEEKWGIEFHQFFAHEINQLNRFAQLGWIERQGDVVAVLARGRPELLEICRTFDQRRRASVRQPAHSYA